MLLNQTCLLIDQRKRPVGQYSIIKPYLGACLEVFLETVEITVL